MLSDPAFVALMLRDDAVCWLCGQGDDPADPLEVEHRKPRAAGGADELANLALAHRSCNQAKGVAPVGGVS